jgi:hypothetical protein
MLIYTPNKPWINLNQCQTTTHTGANVLIYTITVIKIVLAHGKYINVNFFESFEFVGSNLAL